MREVDRSFARRRGLCVAAALGLSACATTTHAPTAVAPVTVATPRPVVPWPASVPSSPGGVSTKPPPAPPLAPPRALASATPPALVPVPAPVSPAVAARFPEPAVSFATPAFEPGRQAFTSNDELRTILYELQRGLDATGRGTEIKVLDLGSSQSGLPIEALAFTRPVPPEPPVAAASPAASAASAASGASGVAASLPPPRRPAVVLVAGQHGDEPAGSEALIVIARQLAAGRFERVLDRVDVVLLPRANPDGAVLFERGAADGTDVNRDHLLLSTPEAQAQARLMVDYAPLVVVDLHEYPVGGAFVDKFAALQRFDALLQYATVANLPPFVTKAAEEWFRVPLVAALRGAGLSADWYATTSEDPNDRKLTMGGVGPQIGRNANGLRNAVSLLVETRGGGLGRVDLKRRVQADVVAVTSVLANASSHAADMLKLRQFVERETAALACRGEAVVEAAATSSEYALTVLDRDSGAIRRINVAWDSALELRVLKSRPRPCGYWLAASESDAVRRLRLLGIEVSQLDESGEMRGERYREIGREPVDRAASGAAAASSSAATRIRVQTAPELLDVDAGGYYVSLDQPLANLAIAALEPEAPASYAANRVIESVAAEARILLRPAIRMTTVP